MRQEAIANEEKIKMLREQSKIDSQRILVLEQEIDALKRQSKRNHQMKYMREAR